MKKTIVDVVLYLVMFVAIQLVVMFLATAVGSVAFGWNSESGALLVTVSGVSSLFTLILFIWRKWCRMDKSYIQSRPWATLSWSAVAALGVVIPSVWLQEQMPALPDTSGQILMKIIQTPGGYFIIALLAPVVEETVFRGAILRRLLSDMSSRWTAITVSAVLFALVHGNPAQMPHAFLMGWFLGWLFMRTGSIVPGVVFHWANNTIAYLMVIRFPDPDMKLIDIFQGNQTSLYLSLLFSLCILVPSLLQLKKTA